MPNATVRANARTLPEATNRRTALGAILAAGVAGATATLPAAASAERPLSAADRQVLALWRRRAELRAIATRLSEQLDAADAQLPAWARSGPMYFRPDGSPAGLPASAAWPMVADLSRRPVDGRGLVNARPGPLDLCEEFMLAFHKADADDKPAVLEEYGRVFAEFADLSHRRAAEEERLGINDLEQRSEAARDAVGDIESELEEHVGESVLALAGVLIVREEDFEDVEGIDRATLAAIRPQLVGAIAADVDRVLAEADEEKATPSNGEPV